MNFEILLVVLTLLTGLVWGWDRWLRHRENIDRDRDPWYIDLPRSLFPIILIVLLVRSFVAEPFRIPSGSMLPTLQAGDFILVNKASYGIRLPVLRSRLFGDGEPERGEVAVFRYPVDPGQDYIKRVIGLPGDEIRYQDRTFYVNGERLEQEGQERYAGPGADPDQPSVLRTERVSGREYTILHHPASQSADFTYTVPEGKYFTVGDNRDRSADSRMWGPVSDDYLAGRAFLIWMSWDSEEGGIAWDRIGQRIE
ncbi:MAG: signal peptidase I [Halorhodospira halophila]|uniref:signal peptidase I n=1 Tax=Halorhodospira TaxID=85108 RepID=UPI0019114593|nr:MULTISPECIES: signal peptidase I [Halorhodospira]MBK5936905.1 signal peptidase I [Halorhodospira halophila]MBK5942350.1 signal peptidase I [Halorhodospira halophila]MCC3750309.1 signal peptidase I [Halorhodospira halophila]MCG5528132.1 signal peptidase I [Halorhodospira halophila]MCG5531901.1 signal peptidase I [Halorhodospira sp. 9621]